MPAECELLSSCGFFRKYKASKDLLCKGIIQMYCTGTKMAECRRKEHRKQHGVPPSDDMMPSGQSINPQ